MVLASASSRQLLKTHGFDTITQADFWYNSTCKFILEKNLEHMLKLFRYCFNWIQLLKIVSSGVVGFVRFSLFILFSGV